MSTGKFQDAKNAALLASQLKQSQVDVFAVIIGGKGDIAAIRNVVSAKVENNVFLTTSFDALRPQLVALIEAVCNGAIK
jgi:basic membrane lipoprotein Med (substrate-binding protein (PBP1-ABC) superfamily)